MTRVSTHSADPPRSAIPVDRSRTYAPLEGHGPIERVMSTVIRKLSWSRLADPKVAEDRHAGETPEAMAGRLARAKAAAVASAFPGSLIIGSDRHMRNALRRCSMRSSNPGKHFHGVQENISLGGMISMASRCCGRRVPCTS